MLVGFPIRQFELCKKSDVKAPVATPATKEVSKVVIIGGKKVVKKVTVPVEGESVAAKSEKCMWVDENAAEQYIKQGWDFTGQKRMSYCPPEWIAGKQGGGILLLDDWNRADVRFIQAVMEIVDRQEYISWKLPKDWHIILTANPDNGNYLVQSIDVAQRTRFISGVLKWDHERWAEWAEQEGIDDRCINFVLMHPEVVNEKVNPRSLTTFFNSISSIDNFDNDLTMVQMVGEGSVGPECATLFTTFIHNRLDKLITPKEMLLTKGDDVVKKRLQEAISGEDGSGQSYRADIASILSTRLLNYTKLYAKDNPITQDVMDRIAMFLKDDELFADDLKYNMVKKVLTVNKQKFQKLLLDSKIKEMALK